MGRHGDLINKGIHKSEHLPRPIDIARMQELGCRFPNMVAPLTKEQIERLGGFYPGKLSELEEENV